MVFSVPVKGIFSVIMVLLGLYLVFLFFTLPNGTLFGAPELTYEGLAREHIISGAYKVYANEEFGLWISKSIIENTGQTPMYNLKVQYKVEGYSDWSEPSLYQILLPSSTIIDLYYPKISEEVISLQTSVQGTIHTKITYEELKDGPVKELSYTTPITITGSRDFIFTSIPPELSTGSFEDIFDNYPLLAAWVTPTDPVIIEFADMGNKIAGGVGASLSDEDAWASMKGMWDLSVYNDISYKTEPSAFWSGDFSQYVKYPRDVIKDRMGTCVDTAIFFASLAISQGLDAYIILMPGHAFPVVALPISGELVPIESTALNYDYSFEDAVYLGYDTYYEAMNGPFLVIDVREFQGYGITPPELDLLPQNVLDIWGIETPVDGYDGGTVTSGDKTYTNHNPDFSISYSTNWELHDEYLNEIDIYSDTTEYVISWDYGASEESMKTTLENFMFLYGTYTLLDEYTEDFAGTDALFIEYSWDMDGTDYEVVVRFFEYQGYGISVLYDFVYSSSTFEQDIAEAEALVSTFELG